MCKITTDFCEILKVTPLSKKIKFDYLITIELEEGIPVRLSGLGLGD